MDVFLCRCIDFIALEGSLGTTIQKLWAYLEKDPTNQLDENIKDFVWDQLQNQPDVCIKVNGEKASKKYPYNEAEGIKELNLSVSKQIREYILGVTDPAISLSELQLSILEIVGKSMDKGILQSQLSEVTKIDPRNLFHHLKKLECNNLLARLELGTSNVKSEGKQKSQTNNTKLVILPRFINAHLLRNEAEGLQMPEQFKNEVCKLLKQAKDHILMERDIMAQLAIARKRKWRHFRDKLVEEGYIRKVKVSLPGSEVSIAGVQLLKDFAPTFEETHDQADDDDEEGLAGNKPVDLVAELTTEPMCYKLIAATGSEGLTQTELGDRTGLSRKLCAAVVNQLKKMYGVYAVPEIHVKQITYRLFAQPPTETAEAPGPLKQIANSAANTANNNNNNNNALVRVSAPVAVPAAVALTPIVLPDTQSVRSTEVTQAQLERPAYTALEGIKRVVKQFPITQDNLKRRRIVLDLLESKKVFTLYHLWRTLIDIEKGGATTIDRKTVNRLVSALEKEKLVETFNLTIPKVHGGTKSFDIVMHHSIQKSDELMKQFIVNLKDSEDYRQQPGVKASGRLPDRPRVVVESLDRMPVKKKVAPVPEDPEMKYSYKIALKYGFIKAKMTRAKIFHNYLWSLLFTDSDPEENPSPTYELKASEVINKFPLDTYLVVVGQPRFVEGLEELIGRGYTIEQLPENIRQVMFYRRIFTRRLNIIYEVLQKLKLVAKKEKEEEILVLASQAEIKDITVSPIVTRSYTFATPSDIMLYWTELEYIAFHKILQQEEEFEIEEQLVEMVEGLPELQNRASWNLPGIRLNRQQKVVLEQSGVPKTREDFMALSHKTGLTTAEVARYFRRDEKKRAQTIARDLRAAAEGSTGAEKSKEKAEKSTKVPATTELSHKKKRLRTPSERKKVGHRSNTRTKWTSQEEHTLLNAFLAEMNQSDGWSKIDGFALVPAPSADVWTKVSGDVGKSIHACYLKMRALVTKFPEPRRILQIAKAQAMPHQERVPIPSSVDVLHKHFTVEGSANAKAHTIPSNNALPDLVKIILQTPESSYSTSLASHVLTNFREDEIVRCFERLSAEGFTTRTRQHGVSRGYQFSNKYMQYFSKDTFPTSFFDEVEAFKKLTQLQLPKQSPLDVEEAQQDASPDLDNYLKIRPMCTGGAVAQAINQIIDGTIKITPVVPQTVVYDDDIHDQIHKNGLGGVKDHLMWFASLDGSSIEGLGQRWTHGAQLSETRALKQLAWQMVIETGTSTAVVPIAASNGDHSAKEVSMEEPNTRKRKENPSEREQTESESEGKRRKTADDQLSQSIAKEITRVGSRGITLIELQKLNDTKTREEIVSILKDLEENKTILEVDDQTQRRYVAYEHARHWCIMPATIDNATQQFKRDASKPPIVLRPWLTLTGEINKEMFASLKDRLFFEITNSPGIRNDKLHEFIPILSPVAIDDLLEALEKEGKVYHRAYTCETPSLFSTFDAPWGTDTSNFVQQRNYYPVLS